MSNSYNLPLFKGSEMASYSPQTEQGSIYCPPTNFVNGQYQQQNSSNMEDPEIVKKMRNNSNVNMPTIICQFYQLILVDFAETSCTKQSITACISRA
jgi:hypothetical protein